MHVTNWKILIVTSMKEIKPVNLEKMTLKSHLSILVAFCHSMIQKNSNAMDQMKQFQYKQNDQKRQKLVNETLK